jgi:hypothetical protein
MVALNMVAGHTEFNSSGGWHFYLDLLIEDMSLRLVYQTNSVALSLQVNLLTSQLPAKFVPISAGRGVSHG